MKKRSLAAWVACFAVLLTSTSCGSATGLDEMTLHISGTVVTTSNGVQAPVTSSALVELRAPFSETSGQTNVITSANTDATGHFTIEYLKRAHQSCAGYFVRAIYNGDTSQSASIKCKEEPQTVSLVIG